MAQPAQTNPSAASIGVNEFLTFTLGKEEYGIPILIVPIVDMRIKFHLGNA